jgi:hypothetical protein
MYLRSPGLFDDSHTLLQIAHRRLREFRNGRTGIALDRQSLCPNTIAVTQKHSRYRRILLNCKPWQGILFSNPVSQLLQIAVGAAESLGSHYTSMLIYNHGVFGRRSMPVIFHFCHLHDRLIVATYFGQIGLNLCVRMHLYLPDLLSE